MAFLSEAGLCHFYNVEIKPPLLQCHCLCLHLHTHIEVVWVSNKYPQIREIVSRRTQNSFVTQACVGTHRLRTSVLRVPNTAVGIRKVPGSSLRLNASYSDGRASSFYLFRLDIVVTPPEIAEPSGRAVLRSIACWDCGFESRRRHGCLSVVSVVFCQVVVCATGRSLVQRSAHRL
jgi:hypothetical protein